MANIKDVAERAGVSITTVSHVLNGTKRVNEDTRLKVVQAIEELNYNPNKIASALRSKNSATKTIAILIPYSENPYFSELVRQIDSICLENDFLLIVVHLKNKQEGLAHAMRMLKSRQVDGVIVAAFGIEDTKVLGTEGNNIPFVIIDFDYGYSEHCDLEENNFLGGYLVTKHLLNMGHSDIAIISGLRQAHSHSQKLDGHKKALEEAGLPFDETAVIEADFTFRGGHDAFMELFSRAKIPTAIAAHNDLMALGAQSAAFSVGLKAPEQVSIIGYYDTDIASYSCPPLSSVQLSTQGIAEQSVALLRARISGETAIKKVTVTPKLVIRRSVQRI
ncbi:LacI family transcriptional regulator [Rhodobacteraceae bacterium RKSG542]|uniref:LacI family DNA-binding transcriptional regulator n=1 Tax=Pseudovibrio flavus TaxID=2529854 RepID=UPI0012BC7F77|nr:LacI family DNA-binding transcriptional regulator [Pseudovibrio flavus]MTI18166.1 LacI family transcriptional regulator [Pseudovibrio flavus]